MHGTRSEVWQTFTLLAVRKDIICSPCVFSTCVPTMARVYKLHLELENHTTTSASPYSTRI
jgi:hypothetical protein